jgi:hypothetical protein
MLGPDRRFTFVPLIQYNFTEFGEILLPSDGAANAVTDIAIIIEIQSTRERSSRFFFILIIPF